jgi:hypothetical protein
MLGAGMMQAAFDAQRNTTHENAAPAAVGDWVNYGPIGGSVYGIAVNPVTPTTVYAGSNVNLLALTRDTSGSTNN